MLEVSNPPSPNDQMTKWTSLKKERRSHSIIKYSLVFWRSIHLETSGKLAKNLKHIALLLRGRQKTQRRLKCRKMGLWPEKAKDKHGSDTESVFLIRGVLISIRIRVSVPPDYGSGSDPRSGSCYFLQWLSRCQQKIIFFLLTVGTLT